jgi:hypothetical protein
MCSLVHIVPLRRSIVIPFCSRNFALFFTWSYKEIPGIDPQIVENEIKTYPNSNIVWKNLRPFNPRKEATINSKAEKILKEGFIYRVPLTEWVSNPIMVDKK